MSSRNNLQDAIQNLFDNTGFSKLIFSGADNSTALSYSVLNDSTKLFGLYRQFEKIINKKLKEKFGGKWLIDILNMTEFSKKDTIDQLLKLASASVPVKTKLCASVGMTPMEVMGADILENNILNLSESWKPLSISSTQSGDSESGRPQKDDSDISESGQQTREIDGNASNKTKV